MRLAFDHAGAAVRLSIAAAMVIEKPVYRGIIYIFQLGRTFAKKCQQRVMTMRPWRGGNRWIEGRDVAIRQQISDEPEAGTRLFQRRAVIETPSRRRRRDHAFRAGASAA